MQSSPALPDENMAFALDLVEVGNKVISALRTFPPYPFGIRSGVAGLFGISLMALLCGDLMCLNDEQLLFDALADFHDYLPLLLASTLFGRFYIRIVKKKTFV